MFSDIAVKNGNLQGYAKPMFADLEVYGYQKNKSAPILHQAKELVLGGVSHMLKDFSTRQLATDIDLRGRPTRPEVNPWQAIAQVLRSAFIEV